MAHTPSHGRAEQAARIAAKPWYRQLYVQVLVAIVIGILLGWRWPDLATDMEPIGTTFITAMKMLIGPIVFLTIIGGIAGVADLKKVGRTGIKALTYFQVGTIVALLTGLVAINVFRLGDGVHADPSTLKTSGDASQYVSQGSTSTGGSSSPTSCRTVSSARSSRGTSSRSSSWPWSSASRSRWWGRRASRSSPPWDA